MTNFSYRVRIGHQPSSINQEILSSRPVIDLLQQPTIGKCVEKFIAQRNISHFEALLINESDPNERRILEAMLREERAKLVAAETKSTVAAR